MRPALEAIINHPANAGLRRHFESRNPQPSFPAVAYPDDVERPYDSLGTHPDLVARLWDELGKAQPADCRAIFFRTPALMHPASGIVFGFAGGTHTYALRLPETERRQALAAGATRIAHYPKQPSFDLAEIGDEWVFGNWHRDEDIWCLAAYEFAAR